MSSPRRARAGTRGRSRERLGVPDEERDQDDADDHRHDPPPRGPPRAGRAGRAATNRLSSASGQAVSFIAMAMPKATPAATSRRWATAATPKKQIASTGRSSPPPARKSAPVGRTTKTWHGAQRPVAAARARARGPPPRRQGDERHPEPRVAELAEPGTVEGSPKREHQGEVREERLVARDAGDLADEVARRRARRRRGPCRGRGGAPARSMTADLGEHVDLPAGLGARARP